MLDKHHQIELSSIRLKIAMIEFMAWRQSAGYDEAFFKFSRYENESTVDVELMKQGVAVEGFTL